MAHGILSTYWYCNALFTLLWYSGVLLIIILVLFLWIYMPWVYSNLQILSQAFSLLPYYLILYNIWSTLLFYSVMTLPRPLTGNILFDFVTWGAALRPSAGNTLRVGRPAALCLQAFMLVSLSQLCFRGFASLPFWPSCTIALGCAVRFWWHV